jgi:7-carboxy-7-deazaguanine synthase
VNLDRIRRHDEVKFVLSDRADFDWAADFVRRHELAGRCNAVLFSPVAGRLDPRVLAGWLVELKLPVRLQIQLHKMLGMA